MRENCLEGLHAINKVINTGVTLYRGWPRTVTEKMLHTHWDRCATSVLTSEVRGMLQGEFVTEEHIQIYSCSIEMFPFFFGQNSHPIDHGISAAR